jgi:hypothetical protein
MLIELAGLSFRPQEAKELVARLEVGHRFLLIPEPTNRYDPYAIQIVDPETEIHIGYVPRTVSAPISKALEGFTIVEATLAEPHPRKPIIELSISI